MDLEGLCDECGRSGQLYSCRLCGRRVCQACMTLGGVCKICAGGRRIKAAEKKVKKRVLKEKGLDAEFK